MSGAATMHQAAAVRQTPGQPPYGRDNEQEYGPGPVPDRGRGQGGGYGQGDLEPSPSRHTVTFGELVERVRTDGLYDSTQRAEAVTRSVLAGLGRQLTGDERVELARVLPWEAALEFSAQIPAARQLTGLGFVQDLAARTGSGPGPARWDTGSVLRNVGDLAGPELLDRVLAQLPDGYALLFGRVQLARRSETPRPAA
ncbi:DUF2267 domain-containing protein [Streptomyces candidus]|uniref:Uncharacterized protein (DUF2267 family) n=1 Tax=Streptomyces candidus TaxID=67283 RepID=A0A7X0HJT9_9ACTN|nr:DUF2267 domain-containing protein [Streptomyces candidus]MBB6438926.1 uncharacterized protein (DUF2267 family) [Streptomyces candidus]GHH44278.1 hypothetical protein GCM10018773_31620 [Streptomyces candidus]